MSIKTAFAKELLTIMRWDSRVVLLTGDLGYGLFDEIHKEFPDRFINAGIREQAMVGMASGMALCGKRPVVYSISTFLMMRAFEQVRNDVVLQRAPVVLVGSAGGYEKLGPTHHSTTDKDLARALELPMICPENDREAAESIRRAVDNGSACYVRLGDPVVREPGADDVLADAMRCGV